MSREILQSIRAEANAAGVPWAEVKAAYCQLKDQEIAKRQRPNAVCQDAWIIATFNSPGCWPFWRHGFASRYGQRVERSDLTAVPGYDEIGQQIATEYPEYSDSAGTERLFEFLMSDYNRLPTSGQLYRQALDQVASRKTGPPPAEYEDF